MKKILSSILVLTILSISTIAHANEIAVQYNGKRTGLCGKTNAEVTASYAEEAGLFYPSEYNGLLVCIWLDVAEESNITEEEVRDVKLTMIMPTKEEWERNGISGSLQEYNLVTYLDADTTFQAGVIRNAYKRHFDMDTEEGFIKYSLNRLINNFSNQLPENYITEFSLYKNRPTLSFSSFSKTYTSPSKSYDYFSAKPKNDEPILKLKVATINRAVDSYFPDLYTSNDTPGDTHVITPNQDVKTLLYWENKESAHKVFNPLQDTFEYDQNSEIGQLLKELEFEPNRWIMQPIYNQTISIAE